MSILYLEDIGRYRPYIHLETRNTSFIRMSKVLEKMGIRNHYFFLSLFQPELRHVDPHDPNLSPELQAKILYESKINIWYYIREVVRIPASGGENIFFELNRGNLACIWSYFNDIDTGLVSIRQVGKTTVTQSIMSWVMYVAADNVRIGFFSKDSTATQDAVRRLKELRDCLPPYFWIKSPKDVDRKESLSYSMKNNFYITFTASNDEQGAYKLGRGYSMAYLHFDEIAYENFNYITVPTAINAMLKASEQVRASGLVSPILYTTTAGNPDTRIGAYALSIFQSATPFTESMYDLQNRDQLLELIDKSSPNRMLYLEFSYKQMGKSDEWLQQAASRSNASEDDINRDLLNIWQSSTDKAIIPQHLLTRIRNSKREPTYVDLTDGFIVKYYRPRQSITSLYTQPLVMGMDTSENVGRDYTTFTILDPTNMEVVATCRCNESNTMQVAKHIVTFLQRYTSLVFIPERNNTGIGIIDFVIDALQSNSINPYLRIYNEVVQNIDDPKFSKTVDIYDYTNIYGTARSYFGFRTTGRTRDTLYKTVMMKYLEMNADRIYDSAIINELCQLTERNGRIDHPVGGHDDDVISTILAAWLIYFGKHLSIYGIPQDTVLSAITTTGSIVDRHTKQEQIAIQQRIATLQSLLTSTDSNVLRVAYTKELHTLLPLVDESITSIQPLAVEQVKHEQQLRSTHDKSTTMSKLSSIVNLRT